MSESLDKKVREIISLRLQREKLEEERDEYRKQADYDIDKYLKYNKKLNALSHTITELFNEKETYEYIFLNKISISTEKEKKEQRRLFAEYLDEAGL